MRAKRTNANPVEELIFQCQAAKLPEPYREYRFHETRRWRFDLAFNGGLLTIRRGKAFEIEPGLAVEVEGGVYVKGAHTRGAHFESDCEKYAEALALGWKVLRVTPRHIRDGRALGWIEKLLR